MAKRFATPKQSMGRGSAAAVPRSLVVLCVLSLVLVVVGYREGDSGVLHGARGVVQTLTSPVRAVGSFVSAPVQGLGNIFGNLTADSETLSDLKAENESLKAQVAQLSESQHDLDTLSSLLEVRNRYSLTSTGATVIGQSTTSWSSTITIDKGEGSGLAIGMPVMTSTGVIGQISDTSAAQSTVRLISDESSGVSAMVQSSRAQGQLVGAPDGTLRLTLVRCDQQVSIGDLVITSGLGGVYPKGLPIGTVTNVSKTSGALYYDITVEPLADSQNLEEVLVITSVSDGQQATTEDAQAADSQDMTTASKADASAAATTRDASSEDGSSDQATTSPSDGEGA